MHCIYTDYYHLYVYTPILCTLRRLALELAEQVGVTLPTTAASNKLYEKVYYYITHI